MDIGLKLIPLVFSRDSSIEVIRLNLHFDRKILALTDFWLKQEEEKKTLPILIIESVKWSSMELIEISWYCENQQGIEYTDSKSWTKESTIA